MFGCGGLDETALGPAAARTQVKAASRASVSCSVPQRRQTVQPAGWRVELKTPRQRKSRTNPRAWIPQVRPSEGSVVSGLTQPRKRKVEHGLAQITDSARKQAGMITSWFHVLFNVNRVKRGRDYNLNGG